MVRRLSTSAAATMHTLFYGLPLGLMYAAGKKRITRRVEVAHTAH
jgi:hypothetical protein